MQQGLNHLPKLEKGEQQCMLNRWIDQTALYLIESLVNAKQGLNPAVKVDQP